MNRNAFSWEAQICWLQGIILCDLFAQVFSAPHNVGLHASCVGKEHGWIIGTQYLPCLHWSTHSSLPVAVHILSQNIWSLSAVRGNTMLNKGALTCIHQPDLQLDHKAHWQQEFTNFNAHGNNQVLPGCGSSHLSSQLLRRWRLGGLQVEVTPVQVKH